MTWLDAPNAIRDVQPALYTFMGLCLAITLVGAIVRAVTGAINGPSSDSDD